MKDIQDAYLNFRLALIVELSLAFALTCVLLLCTVH